MRKEQIGQDRGGVGRRYGIYKRSHISLFEQRHEDGTTQNIWGKSVG